MSDNKNNEKGGKVINIHKFSPNQVSSFTKEAMPYTQICNKVINECQNPVAGFIWIYLQSKPETWKPCKWEIMKRFDISESTYKRHMKYLSATSLIETCMIRDEHGKIVDWRIIVLNGSRFNPSVDNYKGTSFVVHVNQSVKNDTVDEPAPDKGSSQKVKYDPLDEKPECQNTTDGEMNPHINKDITSLVKKEKDTPISPTGKSVSFSLVQMLQDNPFSIPDSVLRDWLEVRRAKKAKITETAWEHTNRNLAKLKESGLCPIDCFVKAVTSGWAGIEVRYFDRELQAPAKPRYPTADERAANEQKIREREMKAAEEKRKEIADSKGFKERIAMTKAERDAAYEAQRIAMGMTVSEYSAYVLRNAAKTTDNG